ncbi:peptidoglycan DD-metalloendopeptidase family protein [Nocardioides sp. WV_118_6]
MTAPALSSRSRPAPDCTAPTRRLLAPRVLLLAVLALVSALSFALGPTVPAAPAAPAAPAWPVGLAGAGSSSGPPGYRDAGASDPTGVWPLAPVPQVVHGFDPPDLPYGAGHRGVDLAGHPGQPVRSALPGQVTFAGRIAGRGVVVVGHGATRTTYEPVAASADLAVGTPVAAGGVLGRLELVGSHCHPHACLHWGWIAGRTYLDPLRLVGFAGPVRLLPLTGERPGLVGPGSTGRRTGVVGALARLGAAAIARP